MPPVLLGGGRSGAITTATFAAPVGGMVGAASETNPPLVMRFAGTVSLYGAGVDANGTARSIQWRKNAANGNGLLTLTDSTAGVYTDNGHTDHFAVTDTHDFTYTVTGTAFIPYFIKHAFTADAGHVGYYAGGNNNYTTSAVTFYAFQCFSQSATETNIAQVVMRTAGTWSNLSVYQSTSSTVSLTTISRKNAANGTQTVTVASGTTGVTEDTTHSDSFVSGDKLNWQTSTPNATGAAQYRSHISYSAVSNEVFTSSQSFAFNASDQFFPAVGNQGLPLTTEAQQKLQHGFAVTTNRFRLVTSANTRTGSTTFVTRKNGADGNQTVSVASGTTGLSEDTTHTDAYGPSDDFNYATRGGTSGNLAVYWAAVTETVVCNPEIVEVNQARNRAAFW